MYKRAFKLFTLIAVLLLLCACGKTGGQTVESTFPSASTSLDNRETSAVVPSETEPMPISKIVIGVRRTGYVFDRVYEAPLGDIKIGGPVEYVNIVFDRNLGPANVYNCVKVTGCNYTLETVPKEVHIQVSYLENGDGIKLDISGELFKMPGGCPIEDKKISISTLKMGAETKYTLFGAENTLPFVGNGDASIVLTSEPKNIMLEFSKDVDKKSMEESISNSPTRQGVQYSFNWIDGKTLKLGLNGLKPADEKDIYQRYVINVEDAVDCDGCQVTWDAEFAVSDPNCLGYIDMNTKENVSISQFKDLSYMAYYNNMIGKYIILHNPSICKVFDVEENKMAGDLTGGPNLSDRWNTIWVDGETMIRYEGDESLYRYSIGGKGKEEIKLPFGDDYIGFMMMSLSHDRSKIAILGGNTMDSPVNPGSLYIISLNGRLLYKYTGITNLRATKYYYRDQEMAWLDDSHVVLEDVTDREKLVTDIVKIDITDGSRETVIKDARVPVTMPGSDIILAEKYDGSEDQPGDFVIVSGNKEIGTIKENPDNSPDYIQCRNFLFIDKGRIVFNRGDNLLKSDGLLMYDINRGVEEALGKGEIIGTSPNRDRIYYMTNYNYLYTFD